MNMIEKLQAYKIDTASPTAAIASMRERGMFDLTADEYRFRIADLANADAPTDDERELNYTYRYLVCGILTNSNESVDRKALLSESYKKAVEFIMANQFVFAKPEYDEGEPKLDATGKPKPKKGKKKEMAIKCYNEKIKDKGLTRKEAIAILMEDVGMTPAGASTYYANLKKGTMR